MVPRSVEKTGKAKLSNWQPQMEAEHAQPQPKARDITRLVSTLLPPEHQMMQPTPTQDGAPDNSANQNWLLFLPINSPLTMLLYIANFCFKVPGGL